MSADGSEAELQANASLLLQADELGNIVLKWAAGDRSMKAALQVIAPGGTEACDQQPQATFIPLDATGFFESDGLAPWPTVGNVLTRFPAW